MAGNISRRSAGECDFRWRWEGESSRIEGLSDGVFGFAITLLVISLEVPRTFDQLQELMRGLVPFAASFAILAWIWYQQYKFFRRYALQDVPTVVLNLVLLFVVIAYVYPLKFLFTMIFSPLTGQSLTHVKPDGTILPMMQPSQGTQLMVIYGIGYMTIFAVFMLLYWHAWRRRDALALTPLECFGTRSTIEETGLQVLIAFLSICIALTGHAAMAGLSYWLIGPVAGLHGWWRGSQKARLFPSESRAAESPTA